jgi:steroid delta-isomerase
MPSRDEICAAVDSYVRLLGSHQIDALMDLFHQGAVQHEPVGARTNRGFDEIRAFFAESEDTPFTVSRLSPVTVVGCFAAMQLRVQREGLADFASTDLFEFDENCKILSITAVPDIKAHIS